MNLTHLRRSLLLLASVPVLGQASIIAYTDSATYLAAAGAQTTFGFDSAYTTSPNTTDYSTASGLTLDGVNFVGGLRAIPGYYYLFAGASPVAPFNDQTYLVGGFTSFTAGATNPYEYVGYETLTFANPVNSVSFLGMLDYSDAGSAGFLITFSNGDSYAGSEPWALGDAAQFNGFISSTPFTSLTITPEAPAADFTDPIFATVPTLYYTPTILQVSYDAAAPEPALLVPGMLSLLAAFVHRRRTDKN